MRGVWTVAEWQHGVFTREQALEAGCSERGVSRRLASGEWVEAQPRVYRVGGAPATWEGRVLAAVLSSGGVASHSTAAGLLGLSRAADRGRVEITVLGTSRPLLRGVVVHITASLEPCDTSAVDGIPTTSGARTVMDVAQRLVRHQVAALVDDAVCARLVNRSWLCRRCVAALSRCATAGATSRTSSG